MGEIGPVMTMRDPLAEFLGALEPGGTSRYTYESAGEVTSPAGPVPPAPERSPLMVAALGGRATADEPRRFGELWQARVRDILDGDPARVVQVARVA